MSLTGNLEDLPLLDIIQIVSFSKKTGYLTIRNSAGEGAIVFSEGTIVASFTWDSPPLDPRALGLPEGKRYALIRNRIEISLEQLIRMREGQFNFSLTESAPGNLSGRDIEDETLPYGINAQELLIDLARGMDEDRRDSAAALEASFDPGGPAPADDEPLPRGGARAPIDDAVSEPEPATWDEELTPRDPPLPYEAPTAESGRLEADSKLPAAEAAGLDADLESLMEEEPGTAAPAGDFEPRLDDIGGEPAPLPHAAPQIPAPIPLPAAAAASMIARTVLLVDDEADVRQILADHIARGGYEVVEAEDPDAALKHASRIGKAGTPFLLVTDLGMPTSGGASFQGGFEVVKRLWKMNLFPPVLMMTETLGGSVQARARQMSIASVVFKPGLSKLDPEQFEADMKDLAAKILTVLPRLAQAPRVTRAPEAPPPPRGAAPRKDASRTAPKTTADEVWDKFAVLQQRLEELRQPSDASQVSMLVMKVAREFFERGLLFLVKNEQLRGLGGFGRGPGDQKAHLVAREIQIPLSEPSIFQDVVANGRPYYGPLPEGRWSREVVAHLGQYRADSVALLPLLANREVLAILYGDNPDSGRDFGRLDPLELFVTQAGVALENAFLQGKLQAIRDNG